MIGEMLYATGGAGDPQEFLSRGYIEAWQRAYPLANGTFNIRDYLTLLEKLKTSPNGVFGMNAQFLQVQSLFKDREKLANFIRKFDKVITLSRKDKIAQAVSWWRASYTGIWSSMDYRFMSQEENRETKETPYDRAGIADRLHRIFAQESVYQRLLSDFNIRHSSFVYENITANYTDQCLEIMRCLGIEGYGIDTKPLVQKQGNRYDPMITAFRKDLGL